MSKRFTRLCLIFAVLSTALTGCAKYPSTLPAVGKQLVVTIQVRDRISPSDTYDPSIRRHYFIAIDSDNNLNTGPWAVAYPPFGGNGWVTSQGAQQSKGVTSFLQYDDSNPGGYVYRVVPDSYLLLYDNPRPPLLQELLDGGSTIRFTIDLSQLATTSIAAADIAQLDVNLITTNELAVNPNDLYPGRQWDGLGPTGQDYVSVDTTTDRTYSGTDDDATTPSDGCLDITYWSIQVQTVSSR